MEINIFSRKSIKSLKTRIFTLAFGSTGRAVATFTVIAIVVTMGILGGSGKLLQPVPSAGPFVGDATYHVMVTPAAIPVGHTTTIIASVDAFIANTVLDVEVTVVGPHGSGILGIENTTISTDSHGNGYVMLAYPGSFKPSASTNAVGTYLVSATFTYGYTTAYAYSHFVVFKNAVFAAPQLYITPGFGPVGTTVDVYGYHFAPPDANITLYYDGIAVSNGSVPKTNATGFFSLTFTVPTSTGLNKVTAVDQYNNTAPRTSRSSHPHSQGR
ncbi:hypothetical protein [Thermogymnomonas acidicola]|uniref:hypothetical protein n=1 Tax=Thermogymnomonas acidicola TaxID=399579 RepID=UPI00094646E3|nr:hypothetical protein [Thermogymnomonas acidicola]